MVVVEDAAPSSAASLIQLSEDATRLGDEQSKPEAPTEIAGRARDYGLVRPGQRLANRFVIDHGLGSGGMGEVFVARDETLGERVALKILDANRVPDSILQRFRREASAARRITHENVVRIHDIGQDGSLHFISMECVEGETLRERENRRNRYVRC